MFGVRDGGGGGGMRAKKKFVYLKWASHFWLSVQNFIVLWRKTFFFCVGAWFGLGGQVRQITPPPPNPVDRHIPAFDGG